MSKNSISVLNCWIIGTSRSRLNYLKRLASYNISCAQPCTWLVQFRQVQDKYDCVSYTSRFWREIGAMGRWGEGGGGVQSGVWLEGTAWPISNHPRVENTVHGWARAQATLPHPANMQRISFSLFDVNMEHGVSQFILHFFTSILQ
jgi:hypothetical protein